MRQRISIAIIAAAVFSLATATAAVRGATSLDLPAIEASPIQGGLCVVVGDVDADSLQSLIQNRPFLVQVLMSNAAQASQTQSALQKQRAYGQITVERWTRKTLPYDENIVSLLILAGRTEITAAETLRVLRPGGEWIRLDGTSPTRGRKPRPDGMDEWTHWRHGPDRNPVSHDTLVEVPGRIQWLSTHSAEGKDMLTAHGRCFYFINNSILARDAFNGLPLWSKKVNRLDAKCSPVAIGELVIVSTPGELLCLNAADGKEVRRFGTKKAAESLAVIDDARDPQGVLIASDPESISLFAVSTGKQLWSTAVKSPRAVSIGQGGIYYVFGNTRIGEECGIACLEVADGKSRWEKQDVSWAKACYRSAFGNGTVVFETGRFAIPKALQAPDQKAESNAVHFYAAKDGRLLKDYSYLPAMRHDENVRAFFVGDSIAVHRLEKDRKASSLDIFRDPTSMPNSFPALPPSSQFFYCYPPVATDRFFIYGQLSFTDWRSQKHEMNPITRGTCGAWTEGILPANGLVYVFPKSCNCFSMLHGFGALAPARKERLAEATVLEKGPAYGRPVTAAAKKIAADDWPCLRGDGYRTGSNPTTVPTAIKPVWSLEIAPPKCSAPFANEWDDYPFSAGPLTPPVIANGTVYLAQPHAHRVFAVNAADGKIKWEFLANGRVDTPPTIHDGLCLFGTRMGWLYCLRAEDGALVYRLRLAPDEQRIVHCGQVESPWPTAGSVLVADGLAFCGVGLHPLADGGIRAFAVEPNTGAIRWQKTVQDMGYNDTSWHGRLGLEQDYFDLFVRDGKRVALAHWLFEPTTGANEFLWHHAYYRVGESGAYMQRGTWSYGYPMNRPRMKRPLVVARGNTVLGANKVSGKDGAELQLFRRDFQPDEKFNVIWDEKPNDTDSRIGNYFPANRLAEKATWTGAYPGWIEALVWAGDNVLLYSKDSLKTYAAADGKSLGEMKLSRPVWDGMAAAGGKLFVVTRDSKITCLGPGK